MRSPRHLTARDGVTLIELMIALVLFVMVFGLAVPFFRFQARSVSESSGRQDALQNARFAQSTIDRDLRVAGAGVLPAQPLVVQAGRFAVTFNADLVSADSADPAAIYFDPSVAPAAVTSMTIADKVTLPLSAVTYPDSNYEASGLPSRAETISFWVSVDSTSGRSDQYILFRRVNTQPPRVVAKGIVIQPGQSLFTYFRPGAGGTLDSIPAAQLPLFHSAPIHGSSADTAASALTDSIRVVRINAWGLYQDPNKGDMIRKVESSTRLINAGMVQGTMCGDVPLPVTGVSAVLDDPVTPTKVEINWTASVDQDIGEKDVERYMVFRRRTTETAWGEPVASVAASQPTYMLDDTDLTPGTWVWAVVAQDCSPSNSSLVITPAITLP